MLRCRPRAPWMHERPASGLCDGAGIRIGLLRLLIVGCLVQAAAAGAAPNPENPISAGQRMFLGETALQGEIAGHAEPLPARTVACANCHLGTEGTVIGSPFAPVLNRSRMTQSSVRRGGPPSMFSPASFCRMLRTGVDPAYVLITRRMPRYTLSDDQCLDLWQYLMETDDEPAKG